MSTSAQSLFRSAGEFAQDEGYALFPFRFGKVPGIDGHTLISSDAGEYVFLTDEQFDQLRTGVLSRSSVVYEDLLAKNIICEGRPETAMRLLAAKLRTKKAFIQNGQAFHIFVVTLRCDHSCSYCQVSRKTPDRTKFDMSSGTVQAAVDRMFETPAPAFTVEFQGGEPLLAFNRIQEVVETIERRRSTDCRPVIYTMTTTLHHATDEMLEFLARHEFQISTSLDGPAELHNANRPISTGDAYEQTIASIKRAREQLGHQRISALTTLTRRSLEYPEAIVDEYVRQGFQTVFLRPLSPYGFALRSERRIGYTMADFVTFYDKALAHILELNKKGVWIAEAYATILLTHILTPFSTGYVDLRSPAGAGLGTFVFNYDGGVYASDESRMLAAMGDETFRLGHVTDPYEQLMASDAIKIIRSSGQAEELPVCKDCVFLPYCGADPVHAYATQGDPIGDRSTSAFCARHMGLFRILFRYLHQGDPEVIRTFLAWVMRKPRAAVSHDWASPC